jgi:F-type H+-transporting ATPase subunit delta
VASVAGIYARAFADVIFGQRLDSGSSLREVQSLAGLAAESKELLAVWEAPSIPSEQKRAVLDALVTRERISRPVRNFIAVLIDHGRIKFLSSIVQQLQQEINGRLGITDAEVISAHELNDTARRGLESEVEKLTGKKVVARYALDASLLGGAVVRVGSTIYDGSVKGKLERMKEALSS